MPKVSICIPTYNGSSFIEETLESALNQTYANFEIIITDDKSSDNTIEICKSFAEKDKRIKIFENEQNLGLLGNWNECIEKASSNWVKLLFQDDLIKPECVEKMIGAAIKHKVNFVICNREYFFEDGVDDHSKKFYNGLPKTGEIFSEERPYSPEETSKLIAPYVFRNCLGEPPTLLLNKDYYSQNDFSEKYFQLIDYIFFLNKILVHDFVYVNENLLKFRVHNTSESKRNNTVDTEDEKSFHKFLYIKYYENLLLCNEVVNNPLFRNIKKHIPPIDILHIKRWIVIESYRRYGFEKVYSFYKKTELSSFILDKFTSSYSYIKYRIYKIINKKYRKKYGV